MNPPMPAELRHAYRALLRAVSYLPDSAARAYLHGHVVHRFRSVSEKIHFRSKRGQPCEHLINRYHSPRNIEKAKQNAKELERAGQGSSVELRSVLLSAYGRKGKRKRELMRELIRPEDGAVPEDHAALEKLIHTPPGERPPRFSPDSKLVAFLKSQRANQPAEMAKFVIRHAAPQIPEENAWGRPVPLKLQESIKRRYWASTLDRILPPLPEHEWNRLRDLATGSIPIEDPPPRRSSGGRVSLTGEANNAKVLKYFTAPANFHNSDFDAVEVDAEKGVTCWEKPIKEVEIPRGDKHKVTARYMRRLYASIWNMTAKMMRDEATKKWVIEWGGQPATDPGQITTPAVHDIELFEGLGKPKVPPHTSQFS